MFGLIPLTILYFLLAVSNSHSTSQSFKLIVLFSCSAAHVRVLYRYHGVEYSMLQRAVYTSFLLRTFLTNRLCIHLITHKKLHFAHRILMSTHPQRPSSRGQNFGRSLFSTKPGPQRHSKPEPMDCSGHHSDGAP